LGLGRVFRSFLTTVEARDPLSLGLPALVLVAVTLLAALVRARSATRADPLTALRQD
jgi:ABC-type antimicrobial peptide transport system permease subunit